MRAAVGDRIRIHGRTVGAAERGGVITEVTGSDASPLLTVTFDDGHEGILAPGADCEITHVD
ncbi:DUF1918 domain-containing protein [Microbacterium sp. Sa4CUA7]|uniref:DUF1918 domain-containing protein n=2 Tax=Microbacterium pullorum TaxID=2762236 RepID=A0ABR8S094_9MICO|nr:DUF1918 domain-containing protein [Microbacterium pullorum]